MTNYSSSRVALFRHSSFGFPSSFVIRISSLCREKRHYPSDHKNVHQRDLEKEQPAQAHELIETKPREGPTNPHENKNDDRHFREEEGDVDQPENPTMRAVGNSRKMPAAEEEGHHQSRAGNHRGVFAEEKEREL